MSMFWTDAQQASERILNTWVLYEDKPVLVERITPVDDDGIVDLRVFPDEVRVKAKLSDKKFHDFRVLPTKGWVNVESERVGMFVERRPTRSRQHGLSSQNMVVSFLDTHSDVRNREYNFETVARDRGYLRACRNEFPPYALVYENIRNGSTIGVNSKFAVHRDKNGLAWLYRELTRVALLPSAEQLLLVRRFAYLKEELSVSKIIPDTVTVSEL